MNHGLQKAREKAQEMREQGIVPERLNPYEKAEKDPNSLRKAISAMCFVCTGSGEPGWREEIRDCRGYKCPLYRHRPYQ